MTGDGFVDALKLLLQQHSIRVPSREPSSNTVPRFVAPAEDLRSEGGEYLQTFLQGLDEIAAPRAGTSVVRIHVEDRAGCDFDLIFAVTQPVRARASGQAEPDLAVRVNAETLHRILTADTWAEVVELNLDGHVKAVGDASLFADINQLFHPEGSLLEGSLSEYRTSLGALGELL